MRKYSPARISKISGNSAFYLDCSTGASLQTQTQVGLKNRNTSYLEQIYAMQYTACVYTYNITIYS